MAAQSVHDFLRELDESRTYYRLTSVRQGAVMVEVALPDERWEIEFLTTASRRSKFTAATAPFSDQKSSPSFAAGRSSNRRPRAVADIAPSVRLSRLLGGEVHGRSAAAAYAALFAAARPRNRGDPQRSRVCLAHQMGCASD